MLLIKSNSFDISKLKKIKEKIAHSAFQEDP
jgi:hypothetical protein